MTEQTLETARAYVASVARLRKDILSARPDKLIIIPSDGRTAQEIYAEMLKLIMAMPIFGR